MKDYMFEVYGSDVGSRISIYADSKVLESVTSALRKLDSVITVIDQTDEHVEHYLDIRMSYRAEDRDITYIEGLVKEACQKVREARSEEMFVVNANPKKKRVRIHRVDCRFHVRHGNQSGTWSRPFNTLDDAMEVGRGVASVYTSQDVATCSWCIKGAEG